jgi:hypothetical protein
MSSNHAKCGALAAAGWPEQAAVTAAGDTQVDIVDSGLAGAIALRQTNDFNGTSGGGDCIHMPVHDANAVPRFCTHF